MMLRTQAGRGNAQEGLMGNTWCRWQAAGRKGPPVKAALFQGLAVSKIATECRHEELDTHNFFIAHQRKATYNHLVGHSKAPCEVNRLYYHVFIWDSWGPGKHKTSWDLLFIERKVRPDPKFPAFYLHAFPNSVCYSNRLYFYRTFYF